ncbi:hypothetical protein LTR16_003253 [Cryomyces antarcticus]|uniref:Uncharacterized protein n=1 Tax=Cryomyces antarcticus TaxID=329879 RepID=A0ABR0KSL6_9PEZI|nr:hypothetical protein LTR60_003708 [Cryomyces antarcticus]KAK5125581.1 hypothetical protein LTR16_003253 [Cryomyces antarcticus]
MAPKKSEANWEKSSEKKVGQRRSPSHQPSDVAIADAVSYIKPYWAEWYHRPKPSTDFITKIERDRSTKEEQLCIRPAAPPLRVPANLAEEHNVDTQVRAGKGMRYVHKTQRPDYLDTMEKPFAVFAFKFRSREILEKILDVEIMEDVVDAKKQMLALSKEELVEELLRVKSLSPPLGSRKYTCQPAPSSRPEQPTTTLPLQQPPGTRLSLKAIIQLPIIHPATVAGGTILEPKNRRCRRRGSGEVTWRELLSTVMENVVAARKVCKVDEPGVLAWLLAGAAETKFGAYGIAD